MLRRGNLAAGIGLWLLAGCATTTAPVPGQLVVIGGGSWAFAERAASLRAAMEADAPLAGELVEAVEHTGMHVLVVRDREPFHRHDHSDITAIVVEGGGYVETLGEPVPARPGDVIVIPRGAPHAFVNTARGGSVLYASFNPPAVAGDRVPLTPDGQELQAP